MSLADIVTQVGEVAFCLAMAAVALLALNLRRALVDRPYRTRALWTAIGALGAVSLSLAGSVVDVIFGQNPNNWVSVIVEGFAWGLGFLGLYGWMVTNVNVAIGADYFNRDALWWNRGGRIAAPASLAILFVFFNLPPWWFPSSGFVYNLTNFIDNTVGSIVFSAVAVYAAAVLALTYRRTGDTRIKTYTKWVVVSILAALLQLSGLPVFVLVVDAILLVYTMYRSVRSLAIRVRTLPT